MKDGMIPVEQAVEMYQLIPNAELAILPNATHASAVSVLSTNIVLDFFLRHSTSSE
jgi:hypothetical protein